MEYNIILLWEREEERGRREEGRERKGWGRSRGRERERERERESESDYRIHTHTLTNHPHRHGNRWGTLTSNQGWFRWSHVYWQYPSSSSCFACGGPYSSSSPWQQLAMWMMAVSPKAYTLPSLCLAYYRYIIMYVTFTCGILFLIPLLWDCMNYHLNYADK